MRRAHSLTRRFAVVSVIAMLLLGAAVVLVTSNLIAKQAMREGVGSAEAVAAYASTHIPATTWSTGVLTPVQRSAVDASTRGFGDRLVRLRVWNVDGTLVFDSEGATTGFPDGQRLDHAIRQESADSRVVEQVRGLSQVGGRRTQVLSVYVPITTSDGVAGAAEVNLDYTETSSALYDATRTIALVTVAGLVLVWLLLFSTVRSASRRLRSTARENARLAMLDSLTGLPNRRLLTERLRRAVDEAREDGTHIGLILLDIDRFKDINDSLGHDYGDALLEQVAARLREALRQEDLVARLGGDEFAVLLPDIRSVEVADRMAQRVRSLFAAPFVVDGITLHASTSIGVACLPDHAQDSSSLMRRADVAMYTAKTHRLGVAIYSPDDDTSSPARLVLLGDLHRAIESTDQLELHYQPKVDLRDGRIVGYEALMRWNHPTRGTVMPGVFIPLAEQSGLIHDVTRFALTEAITQLAHWQERGRAVPVAVNLSAHDVVSTDVVDLIDSLLAEHGVPRHLLEVEITETALVADPSRVLPALQRLSSNGVDVAIDDFGIGSTSISQLRSYPVQRLKIDRLFVTDLGSDQRAGSGSVVQAMVDLAHSFGMRVVAEGVEDRRSADILREIGVDEAQGFAYSTAVPARRGDRDVPPVPASAGGAGGSRTPSVASIIRGNWSSKSDETPQVEARSGR